MAPDTEIYCEGEPIRREDEERLDEVGWAAAQRSWGCVVGCATRCVGNGNRDGVVEGQEPKAGHWRRRRRWHGSPRSCAAHPIGLL